MDIFGGTTITDNDSGEDGGGILFGGDGLMTIDDSTISDNRADENGGGIADEPTLAGGVVMVTNTTIVDNTANDDAAAPPGVGGGIFNGGATMDVNLTASQATRQTRVPASPTAAAAPWTQRTTGGDATPSLVRLPAMIPAALWTPIHA